MVWLFTLPGPEFLKLYVACGFLGYFVVHGLGMTQEPEPDSFQQVRDPYLIAYLRGELDELIRVVTLSLALRGLLTVDSKGIQTVDPAEIERAKVPIEKLMLTISRQRASPVLLNANAQVQAVGQDYRRELHERGLIWSDAAVQTRRYWGWGAFAVLALMGIAKIAVALSTGHPNIMGLIVVLIVTGIVLWRDARYRLTRRGRIALQDLRTLFAHLKDRRNNLPKTAISEATLLAAVFGVYSLMGIDRNAWTRMFVRVDTAGSNGGVSGCGSGCGGGGGGGCGGGGCGGCGS
jgi:uncharacterized protein (TIGR04222 family)